MKEKLMKRLNEIGVIYIEPVKLKHIPTSKYYVDIKAAYGYPDIMSMIVEEMWIIMDRKSNCIAAAGYGGVPLASVLGSIHDLKVSFVRDKPKGHGKGGMIDGYVPTKKDYVAIIDDILTTGGSLEEITEIIEPLTNITEYAVVVKRGDFDSKYPLKYLFEAKEFEKVREIMNR